MGATVTVGKQGEKQKPARTNLAVPPPPDVSRQPGRTLMSRLPFPAFLKFVTATKANSIWTPLIA